ncbi:hypothetical protein CASFOL_040776 [Castilleja foliolosa]|uniref:GDSL esterase/lipase n=1 Tax=Castilleja foliolosa TaxID=1961234 RepID=A0ABD3BE48_9LAMI
MSLIPRFKFLSYFLNFLILISIAEPRKLYRPLGNSASALLIFGDSTVDPGNNNYIDTLFKGNFAPYGTNFVNRIATGRFTDGRLITDFVASYVGIKEYMPAYLDPNLSLEDLRTGVSFASACSGFDPVTPLICRVIPVDRQLEHFKEYKKKLEASIGIEDTKSVISKSAFVISAGTNDMIISYFGSPFRGATYDITGFQQSLLHYVQQFLQDIIEEGARVIGLVGLPPIGCIPLVITLTSGDKAWGPRPCNDALSSIALDYNEKLKDLILESNRNSNSTIIYVDIYDPLNDMIQNPSKYGFENTNAGCCGSGLVEASFLCNPKSVVCPNPSKYVFFDSIHPTEATYNHLFKALQPTIDRIIESI